MKELILWKDEQYWLTLNQINQKKQRGAKLIKLTMKRERLQQMSQWNSENDKDKFLKPLLN